MDNQTLNDMQIIHYNQKKNDTEVKKRWYRLGKKLVEGHKLGLHKESATGARRTYWFYTEKFED